MFMDDCSIEFCNKKFEKFEKSTTLRQEWHYVCRIIFNFTDKTILKLIKTLIKHYIGTYHV